MLEPRRRPHHPGPDPTVIAGSDGLPDTFASPVSHEEISMLTRRTLFSHVSLGAAAIVAGAGITSLPALARHGDGDGDHNGNGHGNDPALRRRRERRHDQKERRRDRRRN